MLLDAIGPAALISNNPLVRLSSQIEESVAFGMMTDGGAPGLETKSTEKRGKASHRRRTEKNKGNSVDEEIVDGFAMASFACLHGDEVSYV